MKISWKKASLSRERRLTAGGALHDCPRRVPGTPYLVHRMRSPLGAGLLLTDTRGRVVQPLVLGVGEFGPMSPLPSGEAGLFAFRPSPEHHWAIHSLTLPSSGPPEEGTVLEGNEAHALDPVVHPHKSTFFFSSDEASPGSFHLWEATPTKKEKRPLTAHPDRSDDQPTISPSGRFLVFRGRRGDQTDLYLLDLQTQETRRLTAAPGQSEEPAFLDEYRLIFSRRLPSGDRGLLLLDILRGKEKWISDALRRLAQPCPGISSRGRFQLWFQRPSLQEGKEVGSDIYRGELSGLRLDGAR